jgi:hypothetical protein
MMEDTHRNAVNKRSASTIIILCAIAVGAVVLVHKESTASGAEELVVGETPRHELDDMMLFQDVKAARKSHAARQVDKKHATEMQVGESIHLEKDLNTDPIPIDTPAIDDTLIPFHASWSGKTEEFGPAQFDSNVVSKASAAAAEAIKGGASEAEAYKKAQEVATDAVVSESAEKGDSPAFSRTIRAAAYAAEMKALSQFEAGHSAQAAKKAAQDAASGLVKDKRAVQIAVPIPNTLGELIHNVDHLWGKMKTNLVHLKKELDGMPTKDCEEIKTAAALSHQEMKHAVQAASEHIAKSHKHKVAMDTQLLQADGSEAKLRQLMSGPNTKKTKQSVKSLNSLAVKSKQASALHHEHAKRQAHLAEGFLSLAAQHHSTAQDAAIRCEAERLMAKFGYAANQMKAWEAHKKALIAAKAKKAQEEKRKAEEERKKAKTDAKKAKKHLLHAKFEDKTAELVSRVAATIAKRMTVAAKQATLETMLSKRGDSSAKLAKKAAEDACEETMKVAAKKLAKKMSVLAKKYHRNSDEAMKEAIMTVLKQGKPLMESIVESAVDEAKSKILARKAAKMHAHKAKKPRHTKVVAVPPTSAPPAPKTAPKKPLGAAEHKLQKLQMLHRLPNLRSKDVLKDTVKAKSAKAVTAEEVAAEKKAAAEKVAAEKAAAEKQVAKVKAEDAKKMRAIEKRIAAKAKKENKTKDAKKAEAAAEKQKLAAKEEVKKVAAAQKKKEKSAASDAKKEGLRMAKDKKKEEDAAKKVKKEDGVIATEKKKANVNVKKMDAEADDRKTQQTHKAEAAAQEQKTESAAKALAAKAATTKKSAITEKSASGKKSTSVMMSTEQDIRKVPTAAAEMSEVVTRATARAAEIARQQVAAAGGTLQQQLQAAAAAAAIASKKSAAIEAAKMQHRRSVVEAAKKQLTRQAEKTGVLRRSTAMHPPHKRSGFQLAMQEAADSKVHELLEEHNFDQNIVHEQISGALKPVMAREINKAASVAAAAAGTFAASKGLSMNEVQLAVASAAKMAAQKAKAQAKQMANVLIGKAVEATKDMEKMVDEAN